MTAYEFEETQWVGQVYQCSPEPGVPLPFSGEAIPAGFPSPAEEYLEGTLDLNELLAPYPEATYFVRVTGESMTGAGIFDGDILVVDRSRTPQNGNVIIAFVDGEFTVKRLRKTRSSLELIPENPDYAPITITPETAFETWGVVQHVIHKV